MRLVPTRHGTHLPHDSACVKSRKKRAMSTMQVVSSMTIMPPEPMIAPACIERVVVDRQVEVLRGQAAAGRAAHLHRLEVPVARDAAADVEDDLAQRDAHRHFDEAGVGHLAGQGEDLGALAALGADGARTTPRR